MTWTEFVHNRMCAIFNSNLTLALNHTTNTFTASLRRQVSLNSLLIKNRPSKVQLVKIVCAIKYIVKCKHFHMTLSVVVVVVNDVCA